jgi:hypothetical protein
MLTNIIHNDSIILITTTTTTTANIVQRTLLQDLTIDEVMRISIVSQLRQHLVADTLYVYLVPCDNLEIEKMPFSSATFLKGGILSSSLLSLVSIDCRHR